MSDNGIENEKNFDTIWWVTNETRKRMLESITKEIVVWSNDNQNMGISPNGKKKSLGHAGFEILSI